MLKSGYKNDVVSFTPAGNVFTVCNPTSYLDMVFLIGCNVGDAKKNTDALIKNTYKNKNKNKNKNEIPKHSVISTGKNDRNFHVKKNEKKGLYSH